MIDTLQKIKMDDSVRTTLTDAIEKKIKKEDLTLTVSVLSSLRSNIPEQLLRINMRDFQIPIHLFWGNKGYREMLQSDLIEE